MSPILEMQMRLRRLGTLRMGELVTRNGKTYPSTRDTWRITTSDEVLANHVKELFGGEVKEWDSKSAERFVVDTDLDSLPIAVVPGHAFSQWYELWSGGGCKRRCDGETETLSDAPCLCDPEKRECKPTTRISVVVRGVDALGVFLLTTGGYYAAVELGGAVQFLEARTARGEAIEGFLRIEQRKIVREGETKVFKVPVLDVAYGIDRMLPRPTNGEAPALEPGHVPILALAPPAGLSVEDALQAVEREREPKTRSARAAEPIGAPLVQDVGGAIVVPVEDAPAAVETAPEKPLTLAQAKKKLDALVGQLRESGHITTEQLYSAVAKTRNVEVDMMIGVLEGARDDLGTLHWAPLRDSLQLTEARELHGRLARLWLTVGVGT